MLQIALSPMTAGAIRGALAAEVPAVVSLRFEQLRTSAVGAASVTRCEHAYLRPLLRLLFAVWGR